MTKTPIFIATLFLIGAFGAPSCKFANVDLVFILDESQSTGKENHKKMLESLKEVTKETEIGDGPAKSHFGLVQFDMVGHVEFSIGSKETEAKLDEAIRNVQYSGGETDIAAGMNTATEVFKSSGRRSNKITLIISDGKDYGSNVIDAHDTAHAIKVETYAVSVGNVDHSVLGQATGDEDRVYKAANYEELPATLHKFACDLAKKFAPPTAPPPTQTTPLPVPGPRSPEDQKHHRGCDPSHLWLDIIAIIDNSAQTGKKHQDLAAVKAALMTVVHSATVGSSPDGRFLRLATIVTSGQQNEPEIVFGLNEYTDKDSVMEAIRKIQGRQMVKFDLKKSLVLANKIINEKNDRKNVKNLVIVFSTTSVQCRFIDRMNERDLRDACRAAALLREHGNTLMTVQTLVPESPGLKESDYGSKCFRLIARGENMARLLQEKLCDANSFCNPPFVQYVDEDSCIKYDTCINGVSYPLGSEPAKLTCEQEARSLAVLYSEKKEKFVYDYANQHNFMPFWVGVEKKQNDYEWADGSKVEYKHWATNEPKPDNGDCAYMKDTTGWISTKCGWGERSGEYSHQFICEKQACDTEHYCKDQ
ncbi:hypothetical protein AB6A40_001526 [Gnathostoma spinigerum]|uniref:C-type lectin n=1 Tax=Gnathostoma spinigerum TaxID=75299 RepID=A0ABD6E6F6_9BILA